MGPLYGSTQTNFASMTVPPLAQYYRTSVGPSRHLPSSIPSCNIHAASHSDSARSIGLSDLQLGGTPSGAFDPPTPIHPPTLTRKPGDGDDFVRIYMVPVAKG